jgi:hypothetical protein
MLRLKAITNSNYSYSHNSTCDVIRIHRVCHGVLGLGIIMSLIALRDNVWPMYMTYPCTCCREKTSGSERTPVIETRIWPAR